MHGKHGKQSCAWHPFRTTSIKLPEGNGARSIGTKQEGSGGRLIAALSMLQIRPISERTPQAKSCAEGRFTPLEPQKKKIWGVLMIPVVWRHHPDPKEAHDTMSHMAETKQGKASSVTS